MRATPTLSALLLLAAAPAALALPMYFSDRAAFDAATGGGLALEGFEANFAVASSIAFAGFTASESGAPGTSNGMGQERDFALVPGSITEGTGALVYADNGASLANFFDFTTPTNAFGLDITITATGGNESVSITGFGGILDSFAIDAGVPQFWGVISDTSISSLSFEVSDNPNVAFDAVSYGLASAPPPSGVPAPGPLSLLGLGLAGLGFSRRRNA